MWLPWQKRNDPDSVQQLGSLESQIVELIWTHGEATVRELRTHLPTLAYTTIMTTLDRLYKKGVLARSEQNRAFVYRARFTRAEYNAKLAERLLNLTLDPEHGGAVLATFVDRVSATDMRLLDDLERLVQEKRDEQKQHIGGANDQDNRRRRKEK